MLPLSTCSMNVTDDVTDSLVMLNLLWYFTLPSVYRLPYFPSRLTIGIVDGIAREMKTLNFGPNGSSLNALTYVFTGKGKYSNISYDPYLSIPGQNTLKNITVKDIESGVVNIILENSVYLSIGLIVGMLMIGSGYVYRKKKP